MDWTRNLATRLRPALLAERRPGRCRRLAAGAEDQIAPVLKAFHDQVLFLKHNLNSRAIGSLKGTSATLRAMSRISSKHRRLQPGG